MKGIHPRFLSYTVALVTVSGALLVTILLKQLLTPTIFLLFFAAVAISSWYGGFKPGLLTTFLSTLAVSFFLLDPKFALSVNYFDSKVRLFLFILVSSLISWLNSELGNSKYKLEVINQQLRQSQAKFKRLADSNIIGVIIADIKGAILEANEAFLRIVGYTHEDLLMGRVNWQNMTPPEYLSASDRAIAELKNQGVCGNLEQEYICKDGSRVYVLVGLALIEPLDLTPIIKNAIETIQPAANAKEIVLKYESEPNIGLFMGDANRLQQIIWNLLTNAVKFTPKGGKVKVQIKRLDSSIEIQVSDTGLGIAPEFLPHVFERFRQADSSSTRSYGGLGLGLAIVRHLVELHGGKVYATSPGLEQGATFVVNLPLKAQRNHGEPQN